MGIKDNWSIWSNGKKAGVVGGSLLAALILAGASVGLVFALKPSKDKTLDLWLPWAVGKQYSKTMKELVDVYNETHDGYDVQITYTDSYGAMGDSFEKEINAGGQKNLPEIYLNYPDVTSKLISTNKDKNYALNLDAEGVDTSKFVGSILSADNTLLGVEDGGIYRLPMAMSSEGMGIDAPLLTWMLQKFVDAGGTLSAGGSTQIISKIIDAADNQKDGMSDGVVVYGAFSQNDGNTTTVAASEITDAITKASTLINNSDKEAIQDKFNLDVGADLSAEEINLSDEAFNSWEGIAKMGESLMKLFNFSKNTTSNQQSGMSFLAIDAIDNTFFQLATLNQLSGGSNIESIYDNGTPHDTTDDVVNYNFLSTSATDEGAKNNASKVFEDIESAIKSNSLWIGYEPDGTGYIPYGSGLFVKHQMPMAIGSTAGLGYYYGYDKADVNAGEVVYAKSPQSLTIGGKEKSSVNQGPSLGLVDKHGLLADEAIMDQAVDFTNWLISDNKITINGTEQTPGEYWTINSNYIMATNSVTTSDANTSTFNDERLWQDGDWQDDGVYHKGNYDGGDRYKLGPAMAYSTLLDFKDNGVTPFNEIQSQDSKAIRAVLKTQFQNTKKDWAVSSDLKPTDEFIGEIKKVVDMFDGYYEGSPNWTKNNEIILEGKN